MTELDDLLADIDDPDVSEKIKAAFNAKDEALAQRQALMDRNAKVQREQGKLAAKFPRAMLAYNKGRFTLPEDASDDALVAALKAKEEELEDLGVPVTQQAATETPVESDPAAAWGEDLSTGQGDTTTQDLFNQFRDSIESGDQNDRLEAIKTLSMMNAQAQQTGDFSKLESLNQYFGPKYPVTKAPPAILNNLTPIHGAGANRAQAQPARRGRPPKAAS